MSHDTHRPILEATGATAREGEEAVRRLVAELEQGLEADDCAALTDRSLANNVMWGSPFGDRVDGYGALHAIHARFRAHGVAKGSRYTIERVMVPQSGMVVAHVRRIARTPSAGAATAGGIPNAGEFSEMALYVLVRSGEDWWVVAGQNTPIRPR